MRKTRRRDGDAPYRSQRVAGRSDEEKRALANRIALDVADLFKMDTEYVSVAYEEVPEAEWDAFCQREIDEKLDKVYKKPGEPAVE